ncbi:hypothetical protein BTHERMOSOX_274 [Bathymodiolus thermophilus thioautotrophic gill symbiont]|jgi:hypothetical protein|uniref:Uncharacterized protein n=1 Tax=Bathymodiolus thermophilus thioautotrophic gill symbiont TaxID=2360 RepID=A0A3G3INY7_9GAMM|nr:hypothetical protein [Bathymodiolus thermophilus thioautotrophic gill symbiont]AYQ57535.1 hypothetical protein MS2017_1862 [Bathymodiolus thermophilus thioautotrophic gill symbiont]CAB5494320.1 hypothetical protein THERMOT_88 [Bathymodiolus thermophilus thioautotrophic gill symbiont]CAB5499613.1 hypothetical protein THERMOS_1048 [Bathymodiolus thermophilus thioautotrophic gill symbiont]SHA30935.1 hypothetical protein BTHERMOSOX_274 [Bathymodiolus thermophilus thioautotrophic gill symbiont]
MFNLKKILVPIVIVTGVVSSGVSMANSNLSQNPVVSSPVFLQNTGSLAMSESSMQKVKGAGFFGDIWKAAKLDIKVATDSSFDAQIIQKLLQGDVRGAKVVAGNSTLNIKDTILREIGIGIIL